MINPHDFAKKQLELTGEFGKFLFNHPDMEENILEGAYIYFDVSGEPEFNKFSRTLAEKQAKKNGVPVILVRVQGLAPPQGSRLINPVIEQFPSIAPTALSQLKFRVGRFGQIGDAAWHKEVCHAEDGCGALDGSRAE